MSQATTHWTQTPEGRKRMAEIARKAAQAPGAKKRMSELAKKSHAERKAKARQRNRAAKAVPWGAHRVDVPEPTRALIARRYAGGENASVLAREFGVSTTTVRTWAKPYGVPGRRASSSNGARPTGELAAKEACGACRTCLLCRKLGVAPQLFMCLVANPLEPGGVV